MTDQKTPASGLQETGVPKQGGAGSEKKDVHYQWVKMEQEDTTGQKRLPLGLFDSTANIRYDPEEHKDLSIIIKTNLDPPAVIMVSKKVYLVKKLAVAGLRAKAEAIVELEADRSHEKDWFDVFSAKRAVVEIDKAPKDKKYVRTLPYYKMVVSESLWEKKIKRIEDQEYKLYDASLFMKETLGSAFLRNGKRIFDGGKSFDNVVWLIVGALISALVAILINI